MPDNATITHIYAGVAKPIGPAAQQAGETAAGIFRWTSDRREWTQLGGGLPAALDVHAISVHPDDSSRIFIGTKSGLFRSKDHGDHWERLGLANPNAECWSVLIHPKNPDVVIVGTAPIGVYRSDDGGETWTAPSTPAIPDRVPMPFPCRVMRLAASQADPDEMYAALEVGGAMRSFDGGRTWEDAGDHLVRLADLPQYANRIGSPSFAEGMLDAHAIAMTPADPETVFLAVRMGLFRSSDKGSSWQDMDVRGFSPELFYGRDIRFSRQDPKVAYAALSIAANSKKGSLWRSDDVGKTWRRFDHSIDLPSTVMGIAPHPRDPQQVYMAARLGQVYGTADAGRSWQELPLPKSCQNVYALACG